jgi:hypothetical protein
MGSIQSSIANATSKVQRRLFDTSVKLKGREVDGIKISVQEDIFQNEETQAVYAYEDVQVVVNYPDDVPITRFRMDGGTSVEETRTFFFDLLPIEIYTKFGDKIDDGDYIFHTFQDENQNIIPMLLQVTESFGRFTTQLIWRKHYAAAKNGPVDQEILDLINGKYNLW